MAAKAKGVTQLLLQWNGGDEAALDQLLPLVYDELRLLAEHYFRAERGSHTLQSTVLVHETYFKLIDQSRVQWQNRAHFFGVASRLMRRILVDHARSHRAAKRGYGHRLTLVDALATSAPRGVDLIALDDALAELAKLDPRQSRVVELRFFGGLTIRETAEVLSISVATVKREWGMAKAWLFGRLAAGESVPLSSG